MFSTFFPLGNSNDPSSGGWQVLRVYEECLWIPGSDLGSDLELSSSHIPEVASLSVLKGGGGVSACHEALEYSQAFQF